MLYDLKIHFLIKVINGAVFSGSLFRWDRNQAEIQCFWFITITHWAWLIIRYHKHCWDRNVSMHQLQVLSHIQTNGAQTLRVHKFNTDIFTTDNHAFQILHSLNLWLVKLHLFVSAYMLNKVLLLIVIMNTKCCVGL